IPRLKVEYQLSRAIFFRYVGQYFAQDQAALEDPRTGQPILGPRTAAVVTNEFRNDVLFSYKPVPGTVCFFGYGASLTELGVCRWYSGSCGGRRSRGGSSSHARQASSRPTMRCSAWPATPRSVPGTPTSTSPSGRR